MFLHFLGASLRSSVNFRRSCFSFETGGFDAKPTAASMFMFSEEEEEEDAVSTPRSSEEKVFFILKRLHGDMLAVHLLI